MGQNLELVGRRTGTSVSVVWSASIASYVQESKGGGGYQSANVLNKIVVEETCNLFAFAQWCTTDYLF